MAFLLLFFGFFSLIFNLPYSSISFISAFFRNALREEEQMEVSYVGVVKGP